MKFLKLFYLGALLAGLTSLAQADGGQDELREAHEAFLKGEWREMGQKIRSVLAHAPNDVRVLNNVSGLLKKTREMNKQVPVDWKLPKEISYLKTSIRHMKYQGEDAFRYQFNLDVTDKDLLEQVQLIRYPNEVLIDKLAGIGEMSVEHNGSADDFWFGTELTQEEPKMGLFLVNLKIKGQDTVQGWIVLEDNMVASKTPRVLSPVAGATVRVDRPTFDFDNFFSPEFQDGEQRRLYLTIRPKGDEDHKWTAKVLDPDLTSATMGEGATIGEGLSRLGNASYRGTVMFEERHRFGPTWVSRQMGETVPFVVKLNR